VCFDVYIKKKILVLVYRVIVGSWTTFMHVKVPIETNNTLFLQGSEILKSENSMLEKNQNGADHAITNITMVNNTEFEPPFEFSPALNSQI